MVCGSSAIVFFSGMPSDAAGPVADSVTPTLMSASAPPAASANAAATRARNGKRFFMFISIVSTSRLSVGEGRNGGVPARRAAGLAHRGQAAEEQVGHERRHLLVVEAAV